MNDIIKAIDMELKRLTNSDDTITATIVWHHWNDSIKGFKLDHYQLRSRLLAIAVQEQVDHTNVLKIAQLVEYRDQLSKLLAA